MILDLSKPEDARKYIAVFRETHMDITEVRMSSGRTINLEDMTDDDAISVAHGLCEIEQAANNGGIQ